jgi:hypothetical protein
VTGQQLFGETLGDHVLEQDVEDRKLGFLNQVCIVKLGLTKEGLNVV